MSRCRLSVVALVVVALVAVAAAAPVHAAGEEIVVKRDGLDPSSPTQWIDPAAAYTTLAWQFGYATCLKLLNYDEVSGALGPDAATAMPTVSPDGRTYTFAVAAGHRFSDGTPVDAASFKRGIERATAPAMVASGGGGAQGLVSDIVGAPAHFLSGGGISGIGAAGNQLSITLAAPAGEFLSRITAQFFCATHPSAPATFSVAPLPSAGPYYVDTANASEVVLNRNLFYGGSRVRNLGTIRWVPDGSPLAADYVPEAAPGLVALPGEKDRTNTTFSVSYLSLNTSKPPFDVVNVRRAAALAVDRTAASALRGWAPTDQFLSSPMPGNQDANLFSLVADVPGAIAALGGAHPSVTLCSRNSQLDVANTVRLELKAAGFVVTVKGLTGGQFFDYSPNGSGPANPANCDLALVGWAPDYLDPWGILAPLFRGGAPGVDGINFSFFTGQDAAFAVAAANPDYASRVAALGALDVTIAGTDVPAIALGDIRRRDVFAVRIGCLVLSPAYGYNLNRLCIQVDDPAVPPGGTVSTGSDADAASPLQTSVTVPGGGAVSITQGQADPLGLPAYKLLEEQLVITAPSQSSGSPLVLTFELDANLLAAAGLTSDSVVVFRNGVAVPGCVDPAAPVPSPCVASRATQVDGDAVIAVHTLAASTYNFGRLATITVDCSADSGALAGALADALDGDTLMIQGTCTGTFEVAHSLTLSGSGGATLDGQGVGPVLTVDPGKTVVVTELTITGGNTAGDGGGIKNNAGATLTLNDSMVSGNTAGRNGAGGGIANFGTLKLNGSSVNGNTTGSNGGGAGIINTFGATLTMNHSTVSGNSGGSSGGGIYNFSTMALHDSVVSGNTTGGGGNVGNGGGIYNTAGTLTVENTTVSGNTAYNGGGGIINVSTLTLRNSTVSGNTATFGGGGGLYNVSSTLTVENSTIAGNTASFGGGINDVSGGRLVLRSSTIAGNTADSSSGGGIFNSFGAAESVFNTIIAGNSGGGCVFVVGDSSVISDGGYNLDDGTSCGFNIASHSLPNTNPLLDPAGLRNNGGPTQTIALQPPSPAKNAISSGVNGCGTTLTSDQRGVSRPQGPACDIGAFELEPDVTAPVIDPHGDEVAEATGPGGAVVSYTSPATSDDVDTPGVASCVPASGSLFPLGPTTVDCDAVDASGNPAVQTHFTVTVLSARAVKQAVLAQLQALAAVDPGTAKKIVMAIDHLQKSVDSSAWVDGMHLRKGRGADTVFSEEKATVKELRGIRNPSAGLAAGIAGWIDSLVAADRTLATTAISEGGSTRDLARANDELARGDTDRGNGKFDLAIDHYRNAWKALKG